MTATLLANTAGLVGVVGILINQTFGRRCFFGEKQRQVKMVHPSDGGGWLILVVAVLVEDLMMETCCHQDDSHVAFAMLGCGRCTDLGISDHT